MSCQSEIEKILTKIPSIPAGLHIYLRGPCHVDLRVEDDHILFPKEHVAVGDQRAAVSLDKDDDGPSGDIQLLDALTDPGMIFLEHHFLELNAFALVVVEGLSSQYHGVPGFHHHVSPGDDDLVIPLDGSHNDPGREVELGDGLSCPLVLVGQMDLNEMDVLPASPVGDTVELDGKSYQVMAVVLPGTSIVDGAMEAGEDAGLDLQYVIPSGTFRELYPDNTLRKLYVNVEDGQVDAMQEMLDTYTASVDRTLPVTSRQSMAQQYQEETRSSAVMGNAISIIIALVGVLNFANSMITAIVSRRREFAMIQSVGMTKRQLCRMLVYEGLYYAGLTLLVSWAVSALAVGIGVRAVTAADDFATFQFTLLPLGICTPLILVLAVVIPYLCFRNLEKHSVVERLRME